MIIEVVNPWRFQDFQYLSGDLLLSDDQMAAHLMEACIVREITDSRIIKLFNALHDFVGREIGEQLKKELAFSEDQSRWYFRFENHQYRLPKERFEV